MPSAANPVAQDTNFACRKILGFLIQAIVLLFIANLVLLLKLFSILKTMAIFVVLSLLSMQISGHLRLSFGQKPVKETT